MRLKSAVENLIWPTIQSGRGAELTALQRQFDESQWWPEEKLQEMQWRQLTALATHAYHQVPFYHNRLRKAGFKPGQPMNADIWARLPALTRADVRDLGEKLHAKTYPPSFGPVMEATSGGSTGIPVRVRKTGIDGIFWESNALREEFWHRDNVEGTFANLKGIAGDRYRSLSQNPADKKIAGGIVLPDYGPPISLICKTGPLGIIQPGKSQAEIVQFLLEIEANYLLMRPAGLRLLLAHCHEHKIRLPSLRSVWTVSECVDRELRAACQEILGCKIVSNYSASETGYMAVQCPENAHYHVMAESCKLEVVDQDTKPCLPGSIGRVLITPLHNFATPLLRYEIGDEAEVGNACSCGRGLPVLNDIVGRTSNYITLKTGERQRVDLAHYRISALRSIKEFQLVQTSLETITLRLAVTSAFSAADREFVQSLLNRQFGRHFTCDIEILESIPKTPAGKLLQFVSEL